MPDTTTQEILQVVTSIQTNVIGLEKKVTGLEKSVADLTIENKRQFGVVNEKFVSIDRQFGVVNEKFVSIDRQFGVVNEQIGGINGQLNEMNNRIDDVLEIVTFVKDNAVTHDEFDEFKKDEFNELKDDVKGIRASMVTKDYLDRKIADVRGDLVMLVRKEDEKVVTTITMLEKNNCLSQKQKKLLLKHEPFARK